MKRWLGTGRALNFEKFLKRGEVLLEEGKDVFAVVEADFFCPVCDGCGCRNCKWTGERQSNQKKHMTGCKCKVCKNRSES